MFHAMWRQRRLIYGKWKEGVYSVIKVIRGLNLTNGQCKGSVMGAGWLVGCRGGGRTSLRKNDSITVSVHQSIC